MARENDEYPTAEERYAALAALVYNPPRRPQRSVRGGLGHREVGAVPPASPAGGVGRGVRGFVDMVGT